MFLVVLTTLAVYGVHERNVARGLAAQKSDVLSALDANRAQIAALTDRLNEVTTQQAAAKTSAASSVNHDPKARAASHRRRAEDPRWKELQNQLAEQQKQIDTNRTDLGNTRTELQGSIARTHDELVVLEKKGERNYYEFDLDKSGQFARKGPVGIKLRKANTKHQFADLELMVDDFKLSQKHVNLYQPVMFYSADGKQPAELVINNISSNHIRGYISEPKYKPAELEAMANSSATSNVTAPSATQPQPRPRLDAPKN